MAYNPNYKKAQDALLGMQGRSKPAPKPVQDRHGFAPYAKYDLKEIPPMQKKISEEPLERVKLKVKKKGPLMGYSDKVQP